MLILGFFQFMNNLSLLVKVILVDVHLIFRTWPIYPPTVTIADLIDCLEFLVRKLFI